MAKGDTTDWAAALVGNVNDGSVGTCRFKGGV